MADEVLLKKYIKFLWDWKSRPFDVLVPCPLEGHPDFTVEEVRKIQDIVAEVVGREIIRG